MSHPRCAVAAQADADEDMSEQLAQDLHLRRRGGYGSSMVHFELGEGKTMKKPTGLEDGNWLMRTPSRLHFDVFDTGYGSKSITPPEMDDASWQRLPKMHRGGSLQPGLRQHHDGSKDAMTHLPMGPHSA